MWGILIVAALAEISYGTINFSATPVYIQTLGLDSSWIAIVTVSYLLSEALFKTPFGALGDRFGRKRLLVIAPLISAVTALLTVFVHNPYLLMILRAMDGMALAALWPSAFGIISDFAREGERAKAMSLFNISYMAGIALAPALGGGINDFAESAFHLSPAIAKQASFYACSILFLVTSVVAFILLPSHCPHHATEETKTTSKTGELSLEGGFSLASFKQMLSQIPMLMLLAFTIFMGVGMVIPYAKLILIEQFHLTESEYGGLIFFPALVIGLLSVYLGTLGDKIGKVNSSRLGLGLAMTGFFFALAFPSKYLLLLFGVIIGTGYVIAYPSLFAYVSDCVAPKQRGTALGAVGTAQGFGAILGGALSAPLYKVSDIRAGGITIPEHGLPFVACAFLLLLAFLVAMLGLKQKPQIT
jgi:DHA1 family multidrug resistance protein-like MFS transporter